LDFLGADNDLLLKANYNSDDQEIKRPLNTTLDLSRFSKFYNVPSIIDGIGEAIEEFKKN
jgi:hypothetical protein